MEGVFSFNVVIKATPRFRNLWHYLRAAKAHSFVACNPERPKSTVFQNRRPGLSGLPSGSKRYAKKAFATTTRIDGLMAVPPTGRCSDGSASPANKPVQAETFAARAGNLPWLAIHAGFQRPSSTATPSVTVYEYQSRSLLAAYVCRSHAQLDCAPPNQLASAMIWPLCPRI